MNTYCMIYNKIKNICDQQYDFFFQKANVVGVGLGYKIVNGCTTNRMCITVYVTQKLPLNSIGYNSIIPKYFCGISTDVIESGYVSVGNFNCVCSNSPLQHRIRPCNGGFSIGANGMPDCSLGCLVKDTSNNIYVLTCNHSIAKNNESSIGVTQITQPAPKYGGKIPRDTVATVSKFEKVNVTPGVINYIDAVICETNASMVVKGLYHYGYITGVEASTLGTKVAKVGAGTDVTTGKIISLDTIIKINFLGQEVLFKDQIITDTQSNSSDEGALLINKKNHAALGIIMGETEKITVCNKIKTVLQALNVDIVTK